MGKRIVINNDSPDNTEQVDAIAEPNWLASFNAEINEHHALVVGGRADVALPAGFELVSREITTPAR